MNDYFQYERRHDAQSVRVTCGVQRLILLTTLAFAVQLLIDIPLGGSIFRGAGALPPGGFIHRWLAFQPTFFLYGGLWKPFTYMFVHASLLHLFFNMLWLFFFGPDVERLLGTRQFFRFYVACGAVGVLATFVPRLLFVDHIISVTGSSGAVMGVLVAFAMANPDRQFFLFPLAIPINARALVIIVVAMNVLTALQPGGNTSVATHFGGMLVGYLYMKAVPRYRRWQNARRPGQSTDQDSDAVGRAFNNIFDFDERKRRR